jgi:hypothetical protein
MSESGAYPFRPREQMEPPAAKQITDVTVMRHDGIYEVDPRLMQTVPQQGFPNWDSLRIAHSREAHLHWMHDHWCHTVISGEEILKDLASEDAE